MQQQLHRPRRKMFAFEEGWRLTWKGASVIIAWANNNAARLSQGMGHFLEEASSEGAMIKFFLYLATAFYLLLLVAQYCLAALPLALWVSFWVILLSLWDGWLFLLMGILNGYAWLYRRYYHITYPCPTCYKVMPLPMFVCPACRRKYPLPLKPSRYGIFFHRCDCRAKLPTLDTFGRNKLTRICPYCNHELDRGFGYGTNINVPVVGGPSSGKTNYLVTATQEFMKVYGQMHDYKISFTNPIHEDNFQQRVELLAVGARLDKTMDMTPQAYSLNICAPKRRVPTLAFLYDASGEVFRTDADLGLQAYYQYAHACILIIDPCAIPAFRRVHQQAIESLHTSLGPSELDVTQVYDRLIRMLEVYRGLNTWGTYKIPLAVVVTKVDALGLWDEIGLPAVQRLIASDASYQTQQAAMSSLVLAFLHKYGLTNMLHDIEMQFSEAQYFSCSALGRLPTESNTTTFVPAGVLEPLEWLFMRTGVIKEVI